MPDAALTPYLAYKVLQIQYITAVSYTHLDVYKRQRSLTVNVEVGKRKASFPVCFIVLAREVARRCAFFQCGLHPVSYTHLDVYKRQLPYWWRAMPAMY